MLNVMLRIDSLLGTLLLLSSACSTTSDEDQQATPEAEFLEDVHGGPADHPSLELSDDTLVAAAWVGCGEFNPVQGAFDSLLDTFPGGSVLERVESLGTQEAATALSQAAFEVAVWGTHYFCPSQCSRLEGYPGMEDFCDLVP